MKTFGFDSDTNENQVVENANRKFTLSKLCEYIWKKTSSSANNINIIDINGIHQDFSTDECCYHVIRFVNYLYEQILRNNTDEGDEINWMKTLNDYLRFYEITVVNYDHKYMVQERAQRILLKNDREVKRVVEDSILTRKNQQINFHDEYELTRSRWNSIARNLIYALKEGIVNSTHHKKVLILTTNMGKIRRKKRKLCNDDDKTTTPPKKEKRLVTYADTFDEMLAKAQLSASKRILNELYPITINGHSNPISNNILYSEMLSNPDYLNNTYLSIPGESVPISVDDYMKSIGVVLDKDDPYTFTLAKYLSVSYQNDHQLRLSKQIFNKLQTKNNNRWKKIR